MKVLNPGRACVTLPLLFPMGGAVLGVRHAAIIIIFSVVLSYTDALLPSCPPALGRSATHMSFAGSSLRARALRAAPLRQRPRSVWLRMQEPGEGEGGTEVDPMVYAQRAIAGSEEDSAVGKKVKELMGRIESLADDPKPPSKLFKALKKPSGAPSIVLEFCLQGAPETEAGGVHGLSDDGRGVSSPGGVRDLSSACRKSKGTAVFVDTRAERGFGDLMEVLSEQNSAKGKFPGPCPVIRREPIIHVAQIAESAVLGAAGVVLSANGLDEEDLKKLLRSCHAAGIEAVVEVCDKESVGSAVQAGAQIFSVRGVSSVDEALALKPLIPEMCAALACVPARQEGQEEIREASKLLSVGKYHGVVLMDVASEGDDVGYLEFSLGALQSKKSQNFDFGTIGTTGEESTGPLTLGAAKAAQAKNPTAWAKAKREAGLIMKDYKAGKRTLKAS